MTAPGHGEGEARASSSRLRNWALPAIAVALGLAMILESTSLSLFEQYTGLGPGFMVAVVGAALVLTGLALAWQVHSGVTFDPEDGEGVDASAPVSWPALATAAAGVMLPIVTLPWLGFPLGAGLSYACITRAFGSRNVLFDLAIGIALGSITWLAFTKLGVQLGPFLPAGVK